MNTQTQPSHQTAFSHIDWANVELPDAWPDQLNWRNPLTYLRFFRHIAQRKRSKIVLPDALALHTSLPKYLLQEFHNLPNGNFSKNIASGYARWFDRVMLGHMTQGRAQVAQHLKDAKHVLDLGCGAGHMAASIAKLNHSTVYGLDASPYLVQYAAQRYPNITWRQGLAEQTGFADAAFDGVSVCFLLHEVPPKATQEIFAELQRIMRAGGQLVILEPSDIQWHGSWSGLWHAYGWRGLYFKWLANHVYEPFVEAWHKQDVAQLLQQNGFSLESDERDCPFRLIVARKD